MQTTQLGRTGEQVSQLALDAMPMGTRTDAADSFAMLDRCLDAGGSFVDTANCYAWWPAAGNTGGESEALLGRWFTKGNRDRVFLSTKGGAWVADPEAWRGAAGRPPYEGAGASTLRRALCVRHGWATPVAVQQQHSYLRPTPGANFLSIVDDEHLTRLSTAGA